jgi:hypothetical protein
MLKIPYLFAGFALLFVCTFSVLAKSKHPIPAPRIESQAPQSNTKNDQGAAKENQRGTENAPLIVKIMPAENTNQPAAKISNEEQKQSSADRWLIIPTWVLAITAIIGNLLTAWLVIGSQRTAKREFRAYVVGVSLLGVPRGQFGPMEEHRPKASNFTGPWQLYVHNFGRTPGFIIKVEWGRCPQSEFPEKTTVSNIIDKKLLSNRMQRPIEGINEICFTEPEPKRFRHVQVDERVVGEVIFRRITYKDIFSGKASQHVRYAAPV